MGTTLLTGVELHKAMTAEFDDALLVNRPDLTSFTSKQRVAALRDAAQWCRDGAPGGSTRKLFSPQGPCALGKVLLGLHEFPGDWMRCSEYTGVSGAAGAILGGDVDSASDPRLVRAATHLAEVAAAFDSGMLEAAARRLDMAADMLVRIERQPDAKELTHEDVKTAHEDMDAAIAKTFGMEQKLIVFHDEAANLYDAAAEFVTADWPKCWKQPGEYLQTWEPIASFEHTDAELVPA